eukprot:2771526-Pyramimonas_sp.AAC.1
MIMIIVAVVFASGCFLFSVALQVKVAPSAAPAAIGLSAWRTTRDTTGATSAPPSLPRTHRYEAELIIDASSNKSADPCLGHAVSMLQQKR